MSQSSERINTFPNIGDICKIVYPKYNLDDFAVCTELRYLPGDPDRPKVRIQLRKVRPKP